MIDISVCMITYNEANTITRAIESISPFVKEVIVVDHYSEDDTAFIAGELGAKVYQRRWSDHFADARNFSIGMAKANSILIMDADEEYIGDGASLNEAYQLMKDQTGVALRAKVKNLAPNNQVTRSCITRMFPKNSGYQFVGRIHEQLLFNEEEPKIFDSTIELKHYGYTKETIEKKGKYQRNVNLLLLSLDEKPFDPYFLFQLGRTYRLMEDYEESRRLLEKSLQFIPYPYPSYHSTLLLDYSTTLMKSKRWNELFGILNTAIENYPDYTDLYYMYGSAIIESQNLEWFSQIPDVFSACIQLGEVQHGKYETVQGVGSYRSAFNLGLYHELIGNKDEALKYYRFCIEQNFEDALVRIESLTNMK